MNIPTISGTIDRRILVNYRVHPDALQTLLPPPFRPKLHNGWGVAGICLIRLKGVRPVGLPGWVGIGSENAAHRVAVEWAGGEVGSWELEVGRGEGVGQNAVCNEGVYVLRRDTGSWLNSLAGGRIFPGVHHRARFEVRETEGRFEVALASDDGETTMSVAGDLAAGLPAGSIFGSPEEASRFFEAGVLGYSPGRRPGEFEGLELRCHEWRAEPLAVERVTSSLFDDRERFPEGTVELDHALVMRGIRHEWVGRGKLEEGAC